MKIVKSQINTERMRKDCGPLKIKSSQGGDSSVAEWEKLIMPEKETMEKDDDCQKSVFGPLVIVADK